MSFDRHILLAFYGDDFTGSTDAMEALTLSGVATVLFLAPPGEADLARFPDCRAFGVAGISRAQSPAWMSRELPPILTAIRERNPAILHYKTCSTFDSSPTAGSIGRAIEIGRDVCGSSTVPLVVGAPVLKRYVVFGNLFATAEGVTYRIDRHPTMSRHPVTPMDEGDLRVHLSRQTELAIGLADLFALRRGQGVEKREPIVLFDTLDEDDSRRVGDAIWGSREEPVQFVAGSSGVEYALTAHWKAQDWISPPASWPEPGPVDRLFVFSGSCSPGTEKQIRWALANGFEGIRLDAASVLGGSGEAGGAIEQSLGLLASGRSVVLYSALGPGDIHGLSGLDRLRLAERSGALAAKIISRSGVRRAVIAGGDTSGFATQALEIDALRVLCPIYPGSPLCTAWRHGQTLEIMLKSGQFGGEDLFGAARRGSR